MILQISARRAEARVMYVTILEMIASVGVLHIIFDTIFCYTDLQQDEVDTQNHDKLLSSTNPLEKFKGLRLTFGLFGKGGNIPLVLLEVFEISIQSVYFLLEVNRTDSFIMIVSCLVLSLNIAISPILIFYERFYACLLIAPSRYSTFFSTSRFHLQVK